jgi:hypothetical protein
MSAPEDPVAAYKTLLRELVARRPSGTRQKIAAATGTHPSFISQLTNPALRVPLPAQHIPTVFKVCHFSAEERAAFLRLYARAHPSQSSAMDELAAIDRDVVRIAVPDFGDPRLRREVETLIREFAERVVALVQEARRD